MRIAGIGTAVPPNSIAQSEATKIALRFAGEHESGQRLIETIYRRSGVENRHSVLLERAPEDGGSRQSFFEEASPNTRNRIDRYTKETPDLAIRSSQIALEKSGLAAKSITNLITVSCTGFHAPGFDFALINQLRLPRDVGRTHVGFMGCHGVLNGLRVAKAFVEANESACVLLCSVELCTLHMFYGWDPEKIVANALFADGAAAIVGVANQDGLGDHYRLVALGSTSVSDSEDAMSWCVGNHGFEMTLSARVPDLIAGSLRPWLDHWLAAHGESIEAIGSWAVHPGGPRILSAVVETTGIPREAIGSSEEVLRDYGNMSSSTILFILERLQLSNASRPCVAMAFGPGLAIEVALFE
jgi:predicted naringenin-chalcone synthase